jgi:tRNA-splicing ligase RtcB (3'-phosphate/5'-hydroxy nucleic acid ligase)
MRVRKLRELGVPEELTGKALMAIQSLAQAGRRKSKEVESQIKAVVTSPQDYQNDPIWGEFAESLQNTPAVVPLVAKDYRTWGTDIDPSAHQQMHQACSVPGVYGGALMPDAHVGYGLPIGGVLAVEGAVIPYAVGVDIACRMKLSVLDEPVESLNKSRPRWRSALERGTRFGIGSQHERPQYHPVMDQDWSITRITRERKDRAWKQLGTSGSGNHFVEFGQLSLSVDQPLLGLKAGQYLALLSHSGSRGAGSAVCDTYSNIARQLLPKAYAELGRLAWLDLDTQAGQEYWMAMNLMGDYASANHDVIHRLVTEIAGASIIAGVENHHNFAWKELHDDRELIVHRKGATPAGPGTLGVIPGSMGTPAFVVAGKGNPDSFDSASHGAGRCMSRTAAKQTFSFSSVRKQLADQGIEIISAGADEVPGVYKDIHRVMAEQQDLVDVLAEFQPRLVKMCGDGSKAED